MKTLVHAITLSLLLALAPATLANEININTATAEELAANLKGVGLNKAKAIVAHREHYGEFTSPDELSDVKGIGLRTVDINRASIQVKGKPLE